MSKTSKTKVITLSTSIYSRAYKSGVDIFSFKTKWRLISGIYNSLQVTLVKVCVCALSRLLHGDSFFLGVIPNRPVKRYFWQNKQFNSQ